MLKPREKIEEKIKLLNWNTPNKNILDLIKPSIRITTNSTENSVIGISKFGGLPHLSTNIEWPILNKQALAFLGQINFRDLEWSGLVPYSLHNKLISFFISPYQEDYQNPNPTIHKTIIQQIDQDLQLIPKTFPINLDSKFQFVERNMDFTASVSMPSYQHWKIEELGLKDEDQELFSDDLVEIFNECLGLNYQPGHQLFGYSDAIQGDTNGSWALKYLSNRGSSGANDSMLIEKKFQQLIQFDLSNGFESISNGCAYFGYLEKNEIEIKIECELQNS